LRSDRIVMLMNIFLLLFLALAGRIFYYQILKGEKISQQATTMRSQHIELREYLRGDIFDRNLNPLTSSRNSWAVYLLPEAFNYRSHAYKDRPQISQEAFSKELTNLLVPVLTNKNEQEIQAEIQTAIDGKQLVRIYSGLSSQAYERIKASPIAGLEVAPIINRYREDGFCAHLLGYAAMGEGSKGQSGLEKVYDDILKGGASSQQLVSVLDARGKPIQGLAFKLREEQSPNGSVITTIDKRIQEVVEKAMDQRIEKGAVVVMDIHSKEILAMASRPTFNPYQIESIISFDERSTLTNRALSRFNPGSLFKILLATAVLEEGKVSMEEQFFCSGQYVYSKNLATACWKKEGHGNLTFAQAFANSCNPTFIQVGMRLGRADLMQYVQKLHLTDESIIGYNPGPIGTYVKIDGGNPALGNACLGQEGVMVSPVQIASLISTVADDGWWAQPSLVEYTIDRNGQKQASPAGERAQVISGATVGKVKQLLEKVVLEGTGKPAAIREARVAGKTATSQTGRMKSADKEILNAWFAGYFPADQPRWAVVVLAEEGSSGSENCAPVFRDISTGILQYY